MYKVRIKKSALKELSGIQKIVRIKIIYKLVHIVKIANRKEAYRNK